LQTNVERPPAVRISRPEDKVHRLLDVGRTLVGELDPRAVLDRILEEARKISGARFAALGVLDERRVKLERFVTSGIDQATHRAIGDLPRGRGVLGVLIEDPRPLRLSDVCQHPQSYGFPPGHPPMRSFVGVPILIRGQAWGNLYLAEKEEGGEFTDEDEDALMALAQWAAIAIENARVYDASEQRREQLERAVSALEAARDITDAVGHIDEPDHVLELIAKRGRALVGAQSLLIMLRDGDDLVVAASAGQAHHCRGRRLPIGGSTPGQVLQRARVERLADVATDLQVSSAALGLRGARTALLVPMLHHGTGIGVLAAFDHGRQRAEFSPHDESVLRTFAQSAASALAIKRSVETDQLRSAIACAEAERTRWARELNDETLQALGGLRVLLASTIGRGDAASKDAAMRHAVENIEPEIGNLRKIIGDLRPSLLDDLGLVPAIQALVARRVGAALQIETNLTLTEDEHIGLAPELQTTVYRLVQEALTNVDRHPDASAARVSVAVSDGHVVVEIENDGVGFAVGAQAGGFGLAGMRERVRLAAGTLVLESGESGTLMRASLPVRQTCTSAGTLSADQVAS
jgi:signal transduction histidine kinase